MKKSLQIVFVLGVLMLTSVGVAHAQSASMSDDKRKLIAELITIFKMDAQMSEMMDAMLKEMEKTYPMTFGMAVDNNPSLSQPEKEKMKAAWTESYQRFSVKFRKKLSEQVDYPRFIRETVYPIYDQFFSEAELKDLLAFYRTPTGQKVITPMPQLFTASQVAAREKLLPQILPILEQIMKEELQQIESAPASAKKVGAKY